MAFMHRIATARSSIWLLCMAVGLANFNNSFLFSIIVPVFPFALKQRFPADNEAEVQRWLSILLAVYGLAWFCFAPICGYIGDYAVRVPYGRRACILAGLGVFLVANTLFCVGTSVPLLVIGRILQGAASAMNQTLPRAMIVQHAGSKKAGMYLGYLSFVGCIGNIASFFLGGLIYEHAGYRAVWILCFGMIGTEIALWLAILETPGSEQLEVADKDVEGHQEQNNQKRNVNVAITTTSPVVRTNSFAFTPTKPVVRTNSFAFTPTSPVVRTSSIVFTPTSPLRTNSIVLTPTSPLRTNSIAAFDFPLSQEKKHSIVTISELEDDSTLDTIKRSTATESPEAARRHNLPTFVRLLISPRIITTILGNLVSQAIFAAFDAVLPQHVNLIFRWGAFPSGLMMTTLYVSGFLDPLVGWICDRYGPKRVAVAGFCLSAPCLVALRAVNSNDTGKKVLLAFLLVTIGFTASLPIIACSAEVAYAVEAIATNIPETEASAPPAEEAETMLAQAYSLNTMANAAACAVGPLWACLPPDAQGWNVSTLSLGIVAAAMAIPVYLWIGGKAEEDAIVEKFGQDQKFVA